MLFLIENSSLISDIYVGTDGKLHKTKGGADTVLNFSSGKMSFVTSIQSSASSGYTFTDSYKHIFIVLTGGRTQDVTSQVIAISLSNGSNITVDHYKYGVQNRMGTTVFDTTTYVAHAYDIAAGTTLSISFNGNAWYFNSLNIIGLK
mgnify:CR=1 FL=1